MSSINWEPAPTAGPTSGDGMQESSSLPNATTGEPSQGDSLTTFSPGGSADTPAPPVAGTGGRAPYNGGDLTVHPRTGRKFTQKGKRMGRTPNLELTEAFATKVAQMAAAGMSDGSIARDLGATKYMVQQAKNSPAAQETLMILRDAFKNSTLNAIQKQGFEIGRWLGEAVKRRDAKEFDYLTRGMAALEKTAASASGESRLREQKNTHQFTPEVKEAEDLLKAFGIWVSH
jgi:hypothetical protein